MQKLGNCLLGALICASIATAAALAKGGADFTNLQLITTTQLPAGYSTAPNASSPGTSEPAIAFGRDGSIAAEGLAWLPFQVNFWTGRFGSAPSFFGAMDTDLQNVGVGRTTLGGDDADVEITSSGTALLADLEVIQNPNFTVQSGVNVTRCPAGTPSPAGCNHIFLDTSTDDRPWITSSGRSAWVSYHDAGSSGLIRVVQSTDDGATWKQVGSPIPGQGAATGDATFNNSIGPIVADPSSGVLYESYMAGEQQTKGSSSNFNNVYVSRSTDGGKHWSSVLVFHADPFTQLANFWPTLAVDPITHAVWTAWTDTHGVWVSSSTDQGATWSTPREVSDILTTVMPSVAARNGKVDVVYYGSTATSNDDPSAVWNAYDSQRTNGTWTVKRVSNTPNRVGAVCLEGSGCVGNKDRELLDLFEVAEDPISGKAAVVYTDSTIDTWTGPDGATKELPEIVLAFER